MEKPIMMSPPMVIAIIDDRKTVTRRLSESWLLLQPGDLMWVKEAFGGLPPLYHYRATSDLAGPWKSPMFMPKDAARLWLRVVSVRKEPLQAITEEEARKEGFGSVAEFIELWNQLHEKKSSEKWEACPDVVRIEFEVIRDAH